MSDNVYNGAAAGFGAAASAFVMNSIGAIIPWLITMTAVIVADLISGILKSIKNGENIRFSKAIRDSMAKFCTYYSVCVCACMTQTAADTDIMIARDACMLIIFIEAISIASNILKWHGYDVDFIKVLSFIVGKRIGATSDEVEKMIHKNDK